MKILFFTYDIPYPLVSGGKIRAYHLIKGLAKKYEITLFSFYRDEDQLQYLDELKKYCKEVKTFKRPYVWSLRNILLCGFSFLPFAAAGYYFPKVKKALLEELENRKYDAAHFESFYPAGYLSVVKKFRSPRNTLEVGSADTSKVEESASDHLRGGGIGGQGSRGDAIPKIVLGNENIEYEIYGRFTVERAPKLLRWLLKIDVWKMKRFEEKLWGMADYNLAVSERDAEVITEKTKRSCWVVPNAVDIAQYSKVKPKESGARTLIFVGDLVYNANDDAMRYFLTEIFPLIRDSVPRVRFILVSATKLAWVNNFSKGVEFLRDKTTPAWEFMSRADVAVVPIRVASGTNFKVLEAMAAGVPVVTTPLGLEGLDFNPHTDLIVADNPEGFARAVVDLLKDPARRLKLGEQGRKVVAEKYSWDRSVSHLLEVYEKLEKKKVKSK